MSKSSIFCIKKLLYAVHPNYDISFTFLKIIPSFCQNTCWRRNEDWLWMWISNMLSISKWVHEVMLSLQTSEDATETFHKAYLSWSFNVVISTKHCLSLQCRYSKRIIHKKAGLWQPEKGTGKNDVLLGCEELRFPLFYLPCKCILLTNLSADIRSWNLS